MIMKKNRYDKYIKIFLENNGILRVSAAIKLGVPLYVIYNLYKIGDLVKEGNGLYRLKEMAPLSNPDLIQICLRVPKCVVCLISALYYYELTTQIPHLVYIAIPRDIKTPKIDYPPIKVFHFSERSYLSGIDEQTIDGVKVRIYDREKTISDCFKFREKIGPDIAIEALKDYMSQPHQNLQLLMKYARDNRVEKVMRPYLEALT
jgi:predicted transcriptional regulator of viral defense system